MKNSIPKLFLPIFFLVGILCFYQSVTAQSGRRPPKQTPSPQSPVATSTPSENDELPVKIENLLIVGEIQDNYNYTDTMSLNYILENCVDLLKRQSNLTFKTANGGVMDFKKAQDIAKKASNLHILWIGFALKKDDKGKQVVNYANYSILSPKTAKKLFTGRIDPEKLANNGGVLGIPNIPKQSINDVNNMRNIGTEIVYRMLRWGWLSD